MNEGFDDLKISYRKETAPSPPLSPLLQASESVERNNNINNNMANLPPTVKNGQADGEIRRKVSPFFPVNKFLFLLNCVCLIVSSF
jgi:hypothetical protein